jgi:hypothetical protein
MLPDIDSRIDGRMMAGTLVTGNFFNALRVSPSLGRALRHRDRWPPEARTLAQCRAGAASRVECPALT